MTFPHFDLADDIQILERELDRLEEERIQLKTDNRALARQLGQKAAELALEPEDLQVNLCHACNLQDG